ncbi:Pre-mRNA cleavage complex II protein Clp1-domain-containing protein [Entophlyctis helioformis]|nr:Pre-mRNA cleavage complex II protein Clp1-domain-containing protein [Entophlyctis helioformis]
MAEGKSVEKREWRLEAEQEFRFEVEPGQKNKGILTVRALTGRSHGDWAGWLWTDGGRAVVQLKSGRAEIFGSELAPGVDYAFSGRKLAVFTWHGCILETSGKFAVEYIGYETPMHSYLNVHLALEQMREAASHIPEADGPRVLVLGPADSGKTALSKILVNYAAKLSRRPIFVDLDTQQGCVSLPGAVGAMTVARPLDCEEEFSASATLMGTTPIAYYYGHSTPLEKPKLYDAIIKKLASVVGKKAEDNEQRVSGFIADAPSQFAESSGFEMLTHAIEYLRVNVILIIGHERLYSDLKRRFGDHSGISVLKLNKSGGAVARDKDVRRKLQIQRVKEYFYGCSKTELVPFNQTVPFSDVAVRRVGEGTLAPSSALPIGMERKQQETRFLKVEAGDILLHSVLAVSHTLLPGAIDAHGVPTKIYTQDEEAQALLESSIAGFVYIAEVNDTKRKMTVLSPNPGRLPKTFLLMGTLKWMDM